MTQITLQNGKVVLRDDKVGTEQNCCCDNQPCVVTKKICWETVFDLFEGPAFVGPDPMETFVDAEAGTVLVTAVNISGCPADELEWELITAEPCEFPFLGDVGDPATLWRRYDRYRAVDDCDECINTFEANVVGTCGEGVLLNDCLDWDEVAALHELMLACGADILCNPLP